MTYLSVGATFGWRPLFLIGVLPALLVVANRLRLPESRKWSVFREQRRQAPRTQIGQARERFPLAQIFASDLRKFTLIGMVLLVAANFANGGILSWAPVFLHQERGLDIASVGWYGIVLAVGQLVGLNVCGLLADRIGRRATLGLFWSLGILSVVAFGLVTNLLLLAGTAFFVGFSLTGIFSGCLIYLSEVFPTRARATGMGWCLSLYPHALASGSAALTFRWYKITDEQEGILLGIVYNDLVHRRTDDACSTKWYLRTGDWLALLSGVRSSCA